MLGCSVSLDAADAGQRWRSAAAAVEERLRGDGGDCRTLVIEVSGDRALVLLTTRDGRQAFRRIESPDELAPLVDALLVTVPPAPPAATEAPSHPAAPPVNTMPAEHPSAQPPGAPPSIVLQANAGGRISTPGGFASPSVGARLGVVVGRWELGVGGQWDPAHALLGGGAPAGFAMSRYAVGIVAGRQVPVGVVSLAFGLTTGVAVVSEVGGATAADQTGGATAAEPLAGAYFGVAWPRRSPLRLRSELSADAVASRIGHTVSIDSSLPDLPWWTAAAAVGVEWEVP